MGNPEAELVAAKDPPESDGVLLSGAVFLELVAEQPAFSSTTYEILVEL